MDGGSQNIAMLMISVISPDLSSSGGTVNLCRSVTEFLLKTGQSVKVAFCLFVGNLFINI